MAPLAKLYKHLLVKFTSYVSARSFRRSSVIEDGRPLENVTCKGASHKRPESHTNTIDKMLARMFPGEVESEMSKTEVSRGRQEV
jgi:hypothetical protein